MKWISICLLIASFSTAQAAGIAVIDSGLDYKHEMIVPNLWINRNEVMNNRDSDGNGYQDDVYGWNFAEQNGHVIDYKYLGTFSPNTSKYFEIQGKVFLNQATEAEITWLREIVKDKNFISEMGKFGNFIHGTHVAGIAIRNSNNKAMGIKLIPTEIKPFMDRLACEAHTKSGFRWSILERTFNALAAQQMGMLTEIARFIDMHKVGIANGSFGTGFNQVKMITDNAYRLLFFRKPSVEDSNRAAGLFINALIKQGQAFVAAAPNTLFIFASGNDGLSNDVYGTSPANIDADNVISVGATYENEFFAPFSNYGTKTVHVAAPGMLVRSAIPGTEYLPVSGTSQAAPFVANVAGQIKDANPRLRPVEIKNILLGTVDKKGYLSDKVATGGIVNMDRAVIAAQMSRNMSVNEAISRAKSQVGMMKSSTVRFPVNPFSVAPIPLAPVFR